MNQKEMVKRIRLEIHAEKDNFSPVETDFVYKVRCNDCGKLYVWNQRRRIMRHRWQHR